MSIPRIPVRGLGGAALAAAVALAAPALAQVDTGAADFTRYVALGDSLTAGFTSGGLAASAQENSYPALIHRRATGGGAFEQPLVGDPGLPPLLRLISLDPVIVIPKDGVGTPLNLFLARPYDNLAVPGANVDDVVATITDFGGLHDLILRGLGTQLQQAAALAPTFATLWIGNNDALGAATSGLVIEGVTLTPLASFEANYRTIANTLRAVGARLAVATIPNVTSIPFVTTIDPFVEVPGLGPVFFIGPAGLLGPGDFVLLTASELLAQGIGIPTALGGTGLPLPDEVVLSAGEAAVIQDRVAGYNNVIRTVAREVGAALVDANAIFADIVAEGLVIGGLDYSTDFLTGGIFSYDGVHPTPLGYAVVANEFLRAINETYGADIPLVDLFDFVFGEPGRAPQIAAAAPFRFAPAAWENLRFALGLPGALAAPPAAETQDDGGVVPGGTVLPRPQVDPARGRPNDPGASGGLEGPGLEGVVPAVAPRPKVRAEGLRSPFER